jgi:hypothetical protein
MNVSLPLQDRPSFVSRDLWAAVQPEHVRDRTFVARRDSDVVGAATFSLHDVEGEGSLVKLYVDPKLPDASVTQSLIWRAAGMLGLFRVWAASRPEWNEILKECTFEIQNDESLLLAFD